MGLGFGRLLWAWRGGGTAEAYLAGYLIEKSLPLDNLFVFAVIFRLRDPVPLAAPGADVRRHWSADHAWWVDRGWGGAVGGLRPGHLRLCRRAALCRSQDAARRQRPEAAEQPGAARLCSPGRLRGRRS